MQRQTDAVNRDTYSGLSRQPFITRAVVDYWLLSTNRLQSPIAEGNTHTTHHWTRKSRAGVYKYPSLYMTAFLFYFIVLFGTGRYPACYQRKNINTIPATNSLIYNDLLACKRCQCFGGTKLVGVNK